MAKIYGSAISTGWKIDRVENFVRGRREFLIKMTSAERRESEPCRRGKPRPPTGRQRWPESFAAEKSGRDGAAAETEASSIPAAELTAQAESLDNLLITLVVSSGQIVQKLAPSRHQLQQAATGGKIFLIPRKVVGQVRDARRQTCYLDICTTGVGVVQLEFFQICGCFSHFLEQGGIALMQVLGSL